MAKKTTFMKMLNKLCGLQNENTKAIKRNKVVLMRKLKRTSNFTLVKKERKKREKTIFVKVKKYVFVISWSLQFHNITYLHFLLLLFYENCIRRFSHWFFTLIVSTSFAVFPAMLCWFCSSLFLYLLFIWMAYYLAPQLFRKCCLWLWLWLRFPFYSFNANYLIHLACLSIQRLHITLAHAAI